MAATGGFTRRICAVLLADVSGYSVLVGRDDERTAEAVHRLQRIVREIAAEARGQAEPRAGDAILATFDSVVAAVDAGLAIMRRLGSDEFAGAPLQIRIGIHFGDILLRDGASFNEAVGDAINVAARLEALARPGTICVSDGVYRHVHHKLDETFIDLGRQQLKNISDPVHAYLIIPRELAAPRLRRPRRALLAGGALLAAAAVAAALFLLRRDAATAPPLPHRDGLAGVGQPAAADDPDVPAGQIALGVMGFKSAGESGPDDWRREALRDGLNAQLSRLSSVKVYSKEFLDFLVSRKGLTEIEAATQLGIGKMLSGSFIATRGTLQIEVHVVDVTSGVMESSYTASAPEAEFLELQNELTMGMIARLDLPVTEEEKQILLAQRATNVEALKLLLEAEGGVAAEPPRPPGPGSRLFGPPASWLGPAAASAADGAPAEGAIREVLAQYRRAMESGAVDALAGLYAEFPPALQSAQQRYFDNVRDLRVAIDNLDIAIVGDEAVVSYTRTDDFTDARTGRQMHAAVRVTKTLRQVDGAWKLTAQ